MSKVSISSGFVEQPDQLLERWSRSAFSCFLLLILFNTLFPFDFSFTRSAAEVIQSFYWGFSGASALKEIARNALLFLPFGFSLASVLRQKKLSRWQKFGAIVLITAAFACVLEILQSFLPARTSSLSDIVARTAGGSFGALCFQGWGTAILRFIVDRGDRLKRYLSIHGLAAAFLGYLLFVCIVTGSLRSGTSLSNWDQSFPLILGNEHTGDRPWQGYITEVQIADRAVTIAEIEQSFRQLHLTTVARDSLIASYRLTSEGGYFDQTGQSPKLRWVTQPQNAPNTKGVLLTVDRWLETETAATVLSERLRKTSQFTLSVIAATLNVSQRGPARIVSLSNNPYERNFTLGQKGSDLIFRLRTPVTGKNGSSPDLTIPNVFTDQDFHHLIVTYDGSVIRFYVDQFDRLYALEYSPRIILSQYMLPLENWNIRLSDSTLVYAIAYYSVIFIPLGCLIGLIAAVSRGRSRFYRLLALGGILIPVLLIEGILERGNLAKMQPENLLLAVAFAASAALIANLFFKQRLHQRS